MEREIDKLYDSKIKAKRAKIIVYIARKKGITAETIDWTKMKFSREYSNDPTIEEPLLVARYDGDLWFQEYKEGKNRINIRFESPYIK